MKDEQEEPIPPQDPDIVIPDPDDDPGAVPIEDDHDKKRPVPPLTDDDTKETGA